MWNNIISILCPLMIIGFSTDIGCVWLFFVFFFICNYDYFSNWLTLPDKLNRKFLGYAAVILNLYAIGFRIIYVNFVNVKTLYK